MSSAAVSALLTAPSGTAAEPGLSYSLGTSQNRAAQKLLCVLFGRHVFKSQSWAGRAGQGQDCVSADRASGREVLQRTPPGWAPGAPAHLLLEEDPQRGVSLLGKALAVWGSFWWSSSAPLPTSPGRLTGRPGPASRPGSRRISAPRRPELVLSCEQILLLPRGSLQTEDRLAKELRASAIRKPQATTHLASVGDEGEHLQKAFTAGLLCGREKNRDFLIPLLPNTVMCFSLHRCWLPTRDSFALWGAEPTPIRAGLAPGGRRDASVGSGPPDGALTRRRPWGKDKPGLNRIHSALLWRRLLVTLLVPSLALPQSRDTRNATDKPKGNTHDSSQRRFSTNTERFRQTQGKTQVTRRETETEACLSSHSGNRREPA